VNRRVVKFLVDAAASVLLGFLLLSTVAWAVGQWLFR
jgi:hypothetical protein